MDHDLLFPGYCCVIYMQCSTTDFMLNAGLGGPADWTKAHVGSKCTEDYIGIEGMKNDYE